MLVAVTGARPNGKVAPMSARGFDHVFLKPMDKDDLLRLLDAQTNCATGRKQPN